MIEEGVPLRVALSTTLYSLGLICTLGLIGASGNDWVEF